MSRRTADRDDSVQNAAGALGQGSDPDRQKNPAQSIQEQGALPRKGGGVLSPQRQPELSADDRAFHVAHAGHDYSFVRRVVPDAGHRPAAISGVDVFHLQLLPGLTERTFSATLAADLPLPPL